MKIKPTPNNVLIKPLSSKKKTATGIFLPEKQKSQRGRVVAMGKHVLLDNTEGVPEFKVDDIIIHRKWEGEEIKLDISGKPLLFVKYKDILAVEKNERKK